MAIQELSEHLCNQIAAGEVIERPASVIKELVENALDAQSTSIEVRFKEAGLSQIEVIDNGQGIAKEELELAFHRHATSKIKSSRDLFRIHTLGFRGEALASIAAVADVHLQSYQRGAEEGGAIHLTGGVVQTWTAAAKRPGTKVTVEQLFYNTPARLKNLSTLATERAHIVAVMQDFALAHPKVAFHLIEWQKGKQKTIFQTNGSGDWAALIAQLYNRALAKQSMLIHAENNEFQLQGILSLPSETRSSKQHLTCVVNGRVIQNYPLLQGIIAGYGTSLMTHRYPIGVLCLEVDPQLLDVNVHPTKREIRFSKEEQAAHFIKETLAERLQQQEQIPNLAGEYRTATEEKALVQAMEKISAAQEESVVTPTIYKEEPSYFVKQEVSKKVQEAPTLPPTSATASPALPSVAEEETLRLPQMEYFGQLHGTYLFAQGVDGLYIIDQHAAQERIKYEYNRQAILTKEQEMQILALPLQFSFTEAESIILTERLALLDNIGLHLEAFGQNVWLLREYPRWMSTEEAKIRDIIEEVIHKKALSLQELREDTAIRMSCKASVKANHHLSSEEARLLITQLNACTDPYHCPHGRPVIVHLSSYEIERLFKRIQD